MVNLVLVSHSYTLACGVAELAEQMNYGCQIAIAGGMLEPENAIGTDAIKIMMAVEQVYSPDGVVILMDLGSAILSAETALELLDIEMAKKVKLCSAPLVEGALAAVVAASSGAHLTEVMIEAEKALTAKRVQLGIETAEPKSLQQLPTDKALTFSYVLQNPHGLHARPAAKLVETLAPFNARIWLAKDQQFVDARSYNQLIQLQIRHHQRVTFYAEGEEQADAMAALKQLAYNHFGENIPLESSNTLKLQGISILPDKTEGSAVCFQQKSAKLTENQTACITHNQQQLQIALNKTKQQLSALSQLPALPSLFHSLFNAHQLLLEEIAQELQALLPNQSIISACQQVFDEMMKQYQQLDDPYLKARILDVEDLRDRLLCNLYDKTFPLPELQAHSILCADELYPSTLARLLNRPPLAICLAQGSPYSHTALMAQSVNIPLIVQLGADLSTISSGDNLAINWTTGQVSTL